MPAPLRVAVPSLGSVEGSRRAAAVHDRHSCMAQEPAVNSRVRGKEWATQRCTQGQRGSQARTTAAASCAFAPRLSSGSLTDSAAKAPYPCRTTSPWSAKAATASSSKLLLQRGWKETSTAWAPHPLAVCQQRNFECRARGPTCRRIEGQGPTFYCHPRGRQAQEPAVATAAADAAAGLAAPMPAAPPTPLDRSCRLRRP